MLISSTMPLGVTVTVGAAGRVTTWTCGSCDQSPARPREVHARTRAAGVGPPTEFGSAIEVPATRDETLLISISYSAMVTPTPPASAGGLQESVTEPVPHGTALGPGAMAGAVGAEGWLQVSPVSEPHGDEPALLMARTATWYV